MSSWGILDNVQISGTVTTTTPSDVVNGFNSSAFLIDIKAGDYITIASNKYQVQNVISNTQLYLTGFAATNSANVTAFVQQGPKYVANVAFPANNYSIQNVYGVDKNEIAVAGTANATLQTNTTAHTGWVHSTSYTDAYSQLRVKSEVLVALSKNFNANATGVLQTDANDDTQYPDA